MTGVLRETVSCPACGRDVVLNSDSCRTICSCGFVIREPDTEVRYYQ